MGEEYCSEKLASVEWILFVPHADANEMNAVHLFCLREVLRFILQAHNFYK